jgi:hypothetical protein
MFLGKGQEPTKEWYVKPIFTNIRLHWKDFPRTNTLAYSEQLSITAIKSLIILGQDGNIIKFTK